MLEKYYGINEAVGVSINLLSGGEVEINACKVAVENQQLNFEKKVPGITIAEEIKTHFPEGSFIALNLYGKGIFTKQVERLEEVNPGNFSKVLTNANLDDFYFQNFISGSQSFVSAIRKVEADKWISLLIDYKFKPLTLSLGPFPVQHIINQLNFYGQHVVFNGHNISTNEQGEWLSYNYESKARSAFPVKVESEPIDENLITAYATVFQLLLASKIIGIQAEVPELSNALSGVIQKKKLKAHTGLVLVIFFVLLLLNFLTFSWLNSENGRLANQVSKTAQSTVDIQSVNDQIKQKEVLLQEMGWENGVSKSMLVDQIASLAPVDITLTNISVDPVDQASSRVHKQIVFFDRQIAITGNSGKIIPVNEWMARIKTKPWVKNVQLDNFLFNNELNTGQFTIIINY